MAHLLEVSTTQLGAAKHRFESWQRPMVQFILTLPAIVQVAQEIAIMRHGKEEARDATSFLEGLTEGGSLESWGRPSGVPVRKTDQKGFPW